jgi:ABC-type glycerol-3-phosphate transport system substrate-binding protein
MHLAAGQNANCGDKGYVISLNDFIKKDNFDGKAIYGDALWTSSAIYTDGQYYGLPKLGYTFTHLYNKQIFDDFKVPYLTDKSSWDDILAAAKACTGVNPRTGERITIPGGKVPRFSAGSALKARVKG